jgi:ADP-dependent NAD(P)H-hydrate dehydratase / NAD(P)H-hydrate epimerase
MLKIFTVAEMVAAEKAADASGATSYAKMMETAGKAVADAVLARYSIAGRRILVLVGPGNNGGDGLVAARYLAQAGGSVACYLYKARDPQQDDNYLQILTLGLLAIEAAADPDYAQLQAQLGKTDLLIDALLGTGVARPISGGLADLLQIVANALPARRAALSLRTNLTNLTHPHSPTPPLPHSPTPPPPLVAIDCPSGLNCDTGALDPLALPADLTVTFAGPKRGHFIFPGAAACGELVVAGIAIPPDLPAVAGVTLQVMTADDAREMLPKRPLNGHKGVFGTAVIAAGSHHYWGAPALAARAAYRAGAGLVALAVPGAIRPTVAGQLPEATYPPIPDQNLFSPAGLPLLLAAKGRALLVGPGLDQAADFLAALLTARDHLPPLLLDADALNLLAQMENWPSLLPPGSILTPHPGEMARLMGLPLAELQALDRVTVAQEKARAWGQVVLLKGAYTVVAAPTGETTLIPFANPALSVGGSGDVLSGVIVGLLAQGMAPYEAACLGAYLHGAAGGMYGKPSGLLMGELADLLPEVMGRLRR